MLLPRAGPTVTFPSLAHSCQSCTDRRLSTLDWGKQWEGDMWEAHITSTHASSTKVDMQGHKESLAQPRITMQLQTANNRRVNSGGQLVLLTSMWTHQNLLRLFSSSGSWFLVCPYLLMTAFLCRDCRKCKWGANHVVPLFPQVAVVLCAFTGGGGLLASPPRHAPPHHWQQV